MGEVRWEERSQLQSFQMEEMHCLSTRTLYRGGDIGQSEILVVADQSETADPSYWT